MDVLETIEQMRFACQAAKQRGKRLGFVPTMGALHEGHLTLVREGLRRADWVIATIFVNPRQFAAHEDLGRYPRDEAADFGPERRGPRFHGLSSGRFARWSLRRVSIPSRQHREIRCPHCPFIGSR